MYIHKIDSDNESFTISSQETFLVANNQQSSPPKTTMINKNLKTISLALLVLFLLIVSSMMILSSISKNSRFKKPDSYESGSSRYYCHLTRYKELCYDSMSSVINTTVLKSGPGPIFSASLRVASNQLDSVSVSITKSTASNGSRMSDCRAWVHDSQRRLNESLSVLGVDPDVEALTSVEMDNVRAWSLAAKANAYKCYSGLEEMEGVEEVKLGVEKARKCMVNSIRLWDLRGTILYDFYNPYTLGGTDYYDYYDYYDYDYSFMICLYSVLYIFMALLYFLFWLH